MSTKLTELEACVMGLIWESGPCTTYAVRKVLRESPNPHWSGSAGAIYPLVRRLEDGGLLRARPESTGRRRSDLYSVTAKGRRALRDWLAPPLADWATTMPMDPLRVRARFLGVLPPAQRAEFLAAAERQTLAQIRNAEKRCRATGGGKDPYPYLMARGALRLSRARLAWIREAAVLLRGVRDAG